MQTPLTLSIVIPVYNEETQLAACLEAIARQTVAPFEVIVVDNNSTDRTVEIGARFSFVTLLHEKRQGVVFARDRGFDAAHGEIIGRIDADSLLPPDWVANVRRVFADPTVDAASGLLDYRDVGLKAAFDAVDGYIRRYLARRMGRMNEQYLYGGNMALRAEAWRAVRGEVCHIRYYHEDLDLAVHLAKLKRRVIFAPAMRASIAPRQAAAGIKDYWHYAWSNPKVYVEHHMHAQRYMYPIVLFVLGLYLPIHLMYRGYDPQRQRFSWAYLFKSAPPSRVSPVAESVV